ncbi:hypothetical protein LTR37_011662 [Vermiconidia calcicola]|uniref:Uncharacterized protein n=1 Tax=Vermiconidia calcicola TaxID=1690605 RepID=A0ACC3N1R6_9PEZI|nr:hypothetical protein LTR37_011662 [Vermiconidia calcicola]
MLNVKPTISPRSLVKRVVVQQARAVHKDARSSIKDRDVLTHRAQPTVTSSDGTKTLRTRQHGNKTLPLPPLMDAVTIEAKMKYKKPKAAPEQREMTDFQKALAENPFANALATKVRQCNITRVRLPAHFLQQFSAAFSPSPTTEGHIEPKILPTPSKKPTPENDFASGTTFARSSSYVLNNRDLLEHLNAKNRWTQILTRRMKEAWDRHAIAGNLKGRNVDKAWERDSSMPDTVLEKLQNEIVDAVKQYSRVKQDGYCIISLDTLEMAHPTAMDSSLLRRDPHDTTPPAIYDDLLPVYNLSILRLKECINPFLSEYDSEYDEDTEQMIVEFHESALRLHMALQKLGGYLGKKQPEDLFLIRAEEREQLAAKSLLLNAGVGPS